MNYFLSALTVKKNSAYRAYTVYMAVYSREMRAYARKIYGQNYEETLSKAYRHVLENYDDNKGDLAHYVISVIHTIDLSSQKKEISYDEVATLALDDKAFESNNGDPLDILFDKNNGFLLSNANECADFMLKYFIFDYKFFKSRKPSEKTLDYDVVYEKFSSTAVLQAISILTKKYSKDLDELYSLKDKLKFKSYSKDRYLDSFDKSIEYMCEFKGIIVYKRLNSKRDKAVYEIDIKSVIERFIEEYYTGTFNRNIGDIDIYVTLSGQLCSSIEELRELLEIELVGCLLSRMQSVLVLRYEKGKNLLVTSVRQKIMSPISIAILDTTFMIDMRMRVSKAVD